MAKKKHKKKKLWNPCAFVKRYYHPLVKIAFETSRKNLEHAYTFCVEGDKTRPTKYCQGDNCAVIPPTCKTPEKGLVHTHPSRTMRFSVDDVKYALIKGHRFQCVFTDQGEGFCANFKSIQEVAKESPSGSYYIPSGYGSMPMEMLFSNYLANGVCSLDAIERTKWLMRDDEEGFQRGEPVP